MKYSQPDSHVSGIQLTKALNSNIISVIRVLSSERRWWIQNRSNIWSGSKL